MARKVPEGKADDVYTRVPINRHFRFRLVSRTPEGAVVSMEVLPDYLQEEGLVQGGVISAIADNAAVYAFLPDLKPDRTMTSIEFKINFLKAAIPDRGELVARSTVIRKGRHVGVCEVEVAQSGDRIAKGIFTYLFKTRERVDEAQDSIPE